MMAPIFPPEVEIEDCVHFVFNLFSLAVTIVHAAHQKVTHVNNLISWTFFSVVLSIITIHPTYFQTIGQD